MTSSLFSTPQPNGAPTSSGAAQMTMAEHERRVQEIFGPLNRTIVQQTVRGNQFDIGNAALQEKVKRLEVLVDQLQDESRHH
eukprot:173368-Lingulodinium_polyedra.AAC.1